MTGSVSRNRILWCPKKNRAYKLKRQENDKVKAFWKESRKRFEAKHPGLLERSR